ncbi:MAG TPA: metallophosphoesterase [Anaeromyxobacter sp.]|nr:metallophosphoesterase [Anaeromyxobacter sp.]
MIHTVAHVSDLHLGRDRRTDAAARAIAVSLHAAAVDAVLVTGDLTHRGRLAELRAFEDAFAPLLDAGRVVIVPGNHDRAGEDAGATLMIGSRVGVADLPGLHVVRVDSTAPHNRSLVAAHGLVDRKDLAEVDAALAEAPQRALSVVMLHHHVLPLPPDDLAETLSGWLGWPNAEELPRGRELLALARGRCDLVLHGHRHVPSGSSPFPGDARPLAVVNAGCSPERGGAGIFLHDDGRVVGTRWIAASPDRSRRAA